jgi:hypothetical protein
MASTSTVSRALPQPGPDTIDKNNRAGRYGEQFVCGLPLNKYAMAEEGSYYITTNPTLGTPETGTASITAYDATKSFFYFRNTDSPTGAAPRRLYLDYIKLLLKVAPTGNAELEYAAILDYGTARYTSGGNKPTPTPASGDVTATSCVGATFVAGTLVTVAAVNGRTVGRGILCPFIPVIYDQYTITFGNVEMGQSAYKASATAVGSFTVPNAPVVVGPGQNFVLTLFGASASGAPQFEYEIGWYER